jgi:hypothetical protein
MINQSGHIVQWFKQSINVKKKYRVDHVDWDSNHRSLDCWSTIKLSRFPDVLIYHVYTVLNEPANHYNVRDIITFSHKVK